MVIMHGGMFVADRILTLLAERRTLTSAEIRKALPNVRRKSIASALSRMHDKGQIESAGWGSWRLASDTTNLQATKPMSVIEAIRARMLVGR